MGETADHERFLRRAIEIAHEAIGDPGRRPYGGVVVRDGEIVGEGLNRSGSEWDPTSHGETEAIKDACARLRTLDLSGCDMYASCEPCPMCVAAMTMVGIRRLFYAASVADSRAAMAGADVSGRYVADAALIRSEAGAPPEARRMPAQQLLQAEGVAVLQAFAEAHPAR